MKVRSREAKRLKVEKVWGHSANWECSFDSFSSLWKWRHHDFRRFRRFRLWWFVQGGARVSNMRLYPYLYGYRVWGSCDIRATYMSHICRTNTNFSDLSMGKFGDFSAGGGFFQLLALAYVGDTGSRFVRRRVSGTQKKLEKYRVTENIK